MHSVQDYTLDKMVDVFFRLLDSDEYLGTRNHHDQMRVWKKKLEFLRRTAGWVSMSYTAALTGVCLWLSEGQWKTLSQRKNQDQRRFEWILWWTCCRQWWIWHHAKEVVSGFQALWGITRRYSQRCKTVSRYQQVLLRRRWGCKNNLWLGLWLDH